MATIKPDPSFYPSPESAIAGPPEDLAYVVTLDTEGNKPDALNVLDVGSGEASSAGSTCPTSATSCTTSAGTPARRRCARGRRTRTSSAATCSCPGLRSSRIHIVDVKDDPRQPEARPRSSSPRRSRARPATRARTRSTAAPTGSTSRALGAPDGDGPGGIFLLDHDDFSVKGAWEDDRGPQELAYDFWWHLNYDTVITSEWGTPNMVEDGRQPRAAARQPVRPQAPRLGPREAHAPSRRSTSAPSTRWCSSCGRRTTRARPYGLRRRGRLDRRPQRLGLAVGARRRTARSSARR